MLSLDSSRWKLERSSGYAGFRCNECATWLYASDYLICKCDEIPQYVICGVEHGEPVFWNLTHGWIEDINHASTFSKGILGERLPPQTVGVMELSLTGDHLGYYPCTPPPMGS